MTTRNISRCCQMSQQGQNHPSLRPTALWVALLWSGGISHWLLDAPSTFLFLPLHLCSFLELVPTLVHHRASPICLREIHGSYLPVFLCPLGKSVWMTLMCTEWQGKGGPSQCSACPLAAGACGPGTLSFSVQLRVHVVGMRPKQNQSVFPRDLHGRALLFF